MRYIIVTFSYIKYWTSQWQELSPYLQPILYFDQQLLSAYLLSSIAFCAQDISMGNKITDLIGITVAENQCPVKNVELKEI